jgi:putative endonuclease
MQSTLHPHFPTVIPSVARNLTTTNHASSPYPANQPPRAFCQVPPFSIVTIAEASTTMKTYYTYIMASKSRVLYVGVTNDLQRRVSEHRMRREGSFTARYNVNRLVYYENTHSILAAIAREEEFKRWRRSKKVALIESVNPTWADLANSP